MALSSLILLLRKEEEDRVVREHEEGERIEDGKNYRDIFRVLTLSRIVEPVGARGGPPSRITRPSADFGPGSSTRGTDIGARTRTDRPTDRPTNRHHTPRRNRALPTLPCCTTNESPSLSSPSPPIPSSAHIYRRYRFDRYDIGFYPRSSPAFRHSFHRPPPGERGHEELVPRSLCRLRSRGAFSIESFDSIMEQGGLEQVKTSRR